MQNKTTAWLLKKIIKLKTLIIKNKSFYSINILNKRIKKIENALNVMYLEPYKCIHARVAHTMENCTISSY